MKLPLIKQEHCTAGWIASIVVAGLCLAWNNSALQGAQFATGVFLLAMVALFGLFSGESTKGTVQAGILVFAVGTGILLMCARFHKLIGGITFGTSLVPVNNDLGILSGLLWFIPVFTSLRLAAKISDNIYLRALMGGLFVLVPSIFMMLTSESLNLFFWRQEVMTLKAIALWFVVGFFFHFAAGQLEVRHGNPIATRLYFTWFGFFAVQLGIVLLRPM